jgi:hypothetical protein
MVKSVDEIAEWAANTAISATNLAFKWPRRAEFLLRELKGNRDIEERLERARTQGLGELQREIANVIATVNVRDLQEGDEVRLLLALRFVSDWAGMVSFAKWLDEQRPEKEPFTSIPEVRQQYAMALNRLGGPVNSILAEFALKEILRKGGRDSETFGILGRVYKDRWLERRRGTPSGQVFDSKDQFFIASLNAYWDGLQCNPTEIYPAINILILLRIVGYKAENVRGLERYIEELLEKRSQDVEKRSQDGDPYFDVVTKVELYSAVGEFAFAARFAHEAASRAQARWELETSLRTLDLLRAAEQSKDLDDIARVLRDKVQVAPSSQSARPAV